MGKERKSEISSLNILFCILVIFIHVVAYPISAYSVAPYGTSSAEYLSFMIPWRLSAFVVQGFVLLSGLKLFLSGGERQGYLGYLKGRFLLVLLPYLFSFAVYYLYYYFVYDYPYDLGFILNHLLFGSLTCHFYFIPLLFQFYLLLPLWRVLVNKTPPAVTIPIAILITALLENYMPSLIKMAVPNYEFPYNDRLITTHLAFWIIGCYIGKNYGKFTESLKKGFEGIASVHIILTAVYIGCLCRFGFSYTTPMNLFHFVYTLSAIIFLFALALQNAKPTLALRISRVIDRESYGIYLWHMLVLFFVSDVLMEIRCEKPTTAFFVMLASVIFITVMLCALLRIPMRLFSYLRRKK